MKGIARLWLAVIIVAILLLGGATVVMLTRNGGQLSPSTAPVEEISQQDEAGGLTSAQKQFRQQWQKDCQGSGPVTLTELPMRPEDFSTFIPYGALAGAHVTPIDHVYLSPKDYNSPRDAYPVMAMADGFLIEVQRRGINVDTGEARAEEFRYTFQHSCTFFTYFDLVTSLSDEVKAAFPEVTTRGSATGHLKVTAGQVVGRIGGQTLDTAVYNLDRKLTGFIHPELYDGEGWKIYTDDFIKYFSESDQALINSRNPRQAEPRSGKIDYDIDGKLIGNWFREGTKGYIDMSEPGGGNYWDGHLAIVPDLYDPTAFWVSIGNWQGQAAQFAVKGNAPDPATVGVESGLVIYELAHNIYTQANGQSWDRKNPTDSVKMSAGGQVQGVALFQLLEPRKLKAEFFPGKTAAQVTAFTENASFFYR